MDFEKISRRFLYPFYILGLSLTSPSLEVSISTRKISFVDFISTISYLFIVNISFVVSNYAGTLSKHVEIINMVFLYAFLLCEGVLNLTVGIQAIVYRKKIRKLHCMYRSIQKYLSIKIGRNIEFDKLHGRLCCVVIMLWTPYAYEIFVRKVFNWGRSNQLLENAMLILHFFAIAVQMNILIHVEILNFFAIQSTQWLTNRTEKKSILYVNTSLSSLKQKNAFLEIRHFKYIHFHLWKISKHINHIFGWSMAVIIFRNFIGLAYSGYWIYTLVSTFKTYGSILRELNEHHELLLKNIVY